MGRDFEGFERGPLLPLVLQRKHQSHEEEVLRPGFSGLRSGRHPELSGFVRQRKIVLRL